MRGKSDSKLRVLDAASSIVERDGAAHLTIDAVAAESGLSKGGVLYHYPNKHTLLQGMLAKLLSDFETRAERFREQSKNSEIHAWIRAEREQTDKERSMALALLANAAEDPSLLDPARVFVAEVFDRVRKEAADEEFNLILLLAAEGLRFFDMLNLLPLNAAERNLLHDRLLAASSGVNQ